MADGAHGNAEGMTHAQRAASGNGLPSGRRPGRNGRVAIASASAALLMLGAAYAAVPIYKLICQATGLNGTTNRAEAAPGAVGDTRIRVKFNANVSSALPWNFAPEKPYVDVVPGETALAHYEASNRSVSRTVGTATFNVTPEIAGKYFSKIECFCFTEQALAGGQKVDMPVTFFVDPAITKDADAAGIQEITLSYTFFATPAKNPGVAQRAGDAPASGRGPKGSIE